jgi:hypothetical protein
MTESTHRSATQLAKAMYECFDKGDMAGLLALYTDDCVISNPGGPHVPYAGTFRGKDGVKEFVGRIGQCLTVIESGPRDYVSDGNVCVILGSEKVRAKTTGKEGTNDFALVIRATGGLISRMDAHDDTLAMENMFLAS